jgi:PAS domain S-box-containing protein
MDYSNVGNLQLLFVDSLPDCALILLDPDGKVLSWNVGAEELLGYAQAEPVGRPISDLFNPGANNTVGPPDSLAIARKKGRHEEICRRRHRNGTELELWEIVIPLYDAQLQFLAFGTMMRSLGGPAGVAVAPLRAIQMGRRKKVLLVDDDVDARATAANLLMGLGYEVLVASSGVEALDILARDGDIDVLFTDVVMPGGLDGGEVAEKARQIRPDLKILFQSGYFEGALVRQGNIAANNLLLVKPYRRKDLAQMMNMILAEEVSAPDALRLTRQ